VIPQNHEGGDMKSKLIALALVLFFGNVLVASAQMASRRQVTGSRLIISRYGTLLDVVDAKGKSRFGKLKRDGFRVSYKTKTEAAKTLYAIGATSAKGLVPGEVRYHAGSARVTVMSEDKKLAIMSYFALDEKATTLFIRRTIRNISCEPVLIEATRFSYERSFFPTSGGVPMLEDRIDAWDIDICPVGACDSEIPCPTNSCVLMPTFDEDAVVIDGGVVELTECPCGSPDTKPANEKSVSVKIVFKAKK
jgi:hypothetical protein